MSNILIKNGKVLTNDSKVLTTSPSEAKLVASGYELEGDMFPIPSLQLNKTYLLTLDIGRTYESLFVFTLSKIKHGSFVLCNSTSVITYDQNDTMLEIARIRYDITEEGHYIYFEEKDSQMAITFEANDKGFIDFDIYELPFTLGGE